MAAYLVYASSEGPSETGLRTLSSAVMLKKKGYHKISKILNFHFENEI